MARLIRADRFVVSATKLARKNGGRTRYMNRYRTEIKGVS